MPRLGTHFGLQDPRFESVVMPMILPLTLTAAAVLTSQQLLSGFIILNAAATANITLPPAWDLANNIQGVMVGTSFEVEVRAAGAGGATLVAPAGGGVTISGTAAVATLNSKTWLVNFTNVTLGQEAYTIYARGAGVF
jgi:hypothetical protein